MGSHTTIYTSEDILAMAPTFLRHVVTFSGLQPINVIAFSHSARLTAARHKAAIMPPNNEPYDEKRNPTPVPAHGLKLDLLPRPQLAAP